MKSFFSLLALCSLVSSHSFATSEAYATCHGSSTHGIPARVTVVIYTGFHLPTDSSVVVSETGKGRRVFPVKLIGGSDVSVVYAGNANGGIKVAIHDQGPGYLWLGDGRESFSLTCQLARQQ